MDVDASRDQEKKKVEEPLPEVSIIPVRFLYRR